MPLFPSGKFRVALVGFVSLAPLIPARGENVDFEQDVAPILEERCLKCHGEHRQKSGFRVDRRASALRGGDSGAATIVPGKPEKSYLIDVIKHLDPDVKMPPKGGKLPDEEIATLERWIREGAVWPGQENETEEAPLHWSFQPVVRPEAPTGSSHPVDAFLARALEKKGLSFSERADPRSLIRRASIVLTGLAPTPEEVAAYLEAHEKDADDADDAYIALVDRLLASPHFGERFAQHWLDVIRWAETNGSEANLYRKNAWIYRDYVVRAFNEDKPYDRFVREQIAGDSLGSGEATGFLVAGPHVPAATVGREPAAIRQARADRMDEVLQTIGASVMGVTIGCARCHHHKFDPITIQDYYSMAAVFQDVEFGSRSPELSAEHPRRKRGDEIWKDIAKERWALRKLGPWEENWGAFRELHFKPVETKGIRVRFKTTYVGVDELELFGPEDYGTNLAHRRRGTKVSGFPEKGVERRNPIDRVHDGEYGTMIWQARVPKESKDRPWVRFDFEKTETVHRLRISNNREYFYETDYLTRKPGVAKFNFDVDYLKADGTWQPWVGTWYANTKIKEKHPERAAVLAKVQQSIATLAEEGPRPSFVGRFVRPKVTHVLMRGSPENPREEVVPAGPALLAGDLELTSKASGSKRRARFAEWITSAKNPLTARVMANRIWHHVFGSGLVTTTSDFGNAGASPTHPELLDWLAAEFVEPTVRIREHRGKPWSMKSLVRMLVLSDSFRQSSRPREEALGIDAGSALLWRFPPKRVEAEVIRDSILQASATLDRSIGGRGYRIHNVKKTYAQWEVVDNYGEHTWRRMLYQERMRRVDDQIFTAFDFPDCGQVRAKRPISTTPLQALNLLNSPFVIDQSKRIADRATKESNEDEARAIDRCFELLLGRSPTASERLDCLALARESGLAIVCRALINTNEFAFLP